MKLYWYSEAMIALSLVWHMDDFGTLVLCGDHGQLMGFICSDWEGCK